jgi:hypothetical protein
MLRTGHPKIRVWKNIPMDRDKLRGGINELIEVAKSQNHEQIIEKIKKLVPEYVGGNNELQSKNDESVGTKEGTKTTAEKISE